MRTRTIDTTKSKIIALRNMASGILKELDAAERKAVQPAPESRTNSKVTRMQKFEAYYLKKGIL